MTQADQIRIDGLSILEARELEEELSQFQPTLVQSSAADADRYQDLGITAAVILGTAAIGALSVWLAKRRVGIDDKSKLRIEHDAKTGRTVVTCCANLKFRSSEPPDTQTVEKLTTMNHQRFVDALKASTQSGWDTNVG